ncbi:VCBS repeat-containing protein [bacterium]|nr:VCBS repeat-containing protein [bacterium]
MVFERARTFTSVLVAVMLAASPLFAASLNLGPEQIVQAAGSDITVLGYSVPTCADWDSDGRMDLIVGEGNCSFDGKVRVYLNEGSSSAPLFSSFSYVQAGGVDLVVPGGGCLGAFPRVVDWNGDSRKDLLVGRPDGSVGIYYNIGSGLSPTLDGGTLLEVGPSGSKIPINVLSRATVALADWDNDGARDLIVGELDGRVHVFINEGTTAEPDFISDMLIQAAGVNLVVPGARSSPVVMDADGDGREDLLVGNTEGQLLLYSNQGTDAVPLFGTYSTIAADGAPIDLPGLARSRPFVTDWNGDGLSDVLIGASDGRVHLYQGIPEPATLILIALGVPVLLKRSRR